MTTYRVVIIGIKEGQDADEVVHDQLMAPRGIEGLMKNARRAATEERW